MAERVCTVERTRPRLQRTDEHSEFRGRLGLVGARCGLARLVQQLASGSTSRRCEELGSGHDLSLALQRIAWDARTAGLLAYHAWLIVPTAQGCRIITEETQYGVLARLGTWLMPQRMYRSHQHWLEQLDRVARSGMPM
jgi:hypothetical protein